MWAVVPLLFDQHSNLLKDSEVSSVIINLIGVPGSCCDVRQLELGLVQTFGSISIVCDISDAFLHEWE